MALDLRHLHGHTRRIVVRLIVMGVPVTLAFGAVFASLLLISETQALTVSLPLEALQRLQDRIVRVLRDEAPPAV